MGSRPVERKFSNALLEKDEYHDICILGIFWIARLLQNEQGGGKTPSLASFKEAWKSLHFSHIYHAKPKNSTFEGFMQGLYNVCLMLPTLNLSERDLVHLLGELEAASLLTNINAEGIELEWKNLSHITALYCLFCIFEAQPRRPCVLVRIQEHHCSIFQRFSDLHEHAHEDAGHVFSKMWMKNAFCLGASYFSKDTSAEKYFHPGAGSISLTAGLDPLDATTLRESRYHLDSTLRGLGTQYVESLCLQYRNALSNVMIDKRLDDTPESYSLRGIADLNFGYEIHRNVLLASDKIRYNLYGREHGNNVRRTRTSAGSKKPKKSQLSKSLAGANAVLEREQARARDISQKRKCMEKSIGLIQSTQTEVVKSSSDEDSDMPDLWDSLPTGLERGVMSRIKINNALLEKENAKDLNFRRVLTTSPRQYQDRLAGAVIRYGGRPIWIPGIQINELRSETSREQRRAALDALDAVDYLVLPSKNAMFACLKAYDDSISTFQTKLNMEHRNVEVWAMGADADYLSGNLGIKNVKKPKVASTDGIIEAMRTAGSLEGNALVFVPEVVPPLTEPDVVPKFLGNLRDVGITPHRIPAYETVVGLSLQEVVAEVNMLIDGSISAIAFTSTAECEGLCYIIGKEKLLRCIRLHNIVIAAHGLTTAKGVAKVLDFEGQICVSKDSSTFEGMVAAIADCM